MIALKPHHQSPGGLATATTSSRCPTTHVSHVAPSSSASFDGECAEIDHILLKYAESQYTIDRQADNLRTPLLVRISLLLDACRSQCALGEYTTKTGNLDTAKLNTHQPNHTSPTTATTSRRRATDKSCAFSEAHPLLWTPGLLFSATYVSLYN